METLLFILFYIEYYCCKKKQIKIISKNPFPVYILYPTCSHNIPRISVNKSPVVNLFWLHRRDDAKYTVFASKMLP